MTEDSLSGAPEHSRSPSDLPRETEEAIAPLLIGRTVEEMERHIILHTLAYSCGNRTAAAGMLGISVRTLRNKIKQYARSGYTVPEPRTIPAPAVRTRPEATEQTAECPCE
jgi:DNA-binding NtrC family response regulator